jgi:aspartate kinase
MRRVLKYGGTSIETADRVRRAAKNIARLVHEGDQVAVVVSAQGNDTNTLLSAVYAATERHVDAQSVYRIAAMGEEKTVLLLTAALRSLGVEAAAFLPTLPGGDTWPLIVDCEDDAPLAAQKINEERLLTVREEESTRLFGRHVLPVLRRGGVAVLAGFFAKPSSGVGLTTLGRGGSDISGVLAGRFLDADEVTIITDVEGILSADPRLAESPRLIEEMSVEDLEVMASRGARVVHPRAIRYKTERCRVRVVDFRRQEALAQSGTTLLGTSQPSLRCWPGGLAMVTLVGQELAPRPGLMGQLGSALAEAGISIVSSTQNDSFVCLYLADADGDRAYRLLHDAIGRAGWPFESVTLRRDVAEIRLRSPEFLQTPGVLGEITSALGRRRVNILEMITSLTDIYVYVDQADRDAAMGLLSELLAQGAA